MIRPTIVWFGRRMPKSTTAARILVWLPLIIAFSGAGWTLWQYGQGLDLRRAESSFARLSQYQELQAKDTQLHAQNEQDLTKLKATIRAVQCAYFQKEFPERLSSALCGSDGQDDQTARSALMAGLSDAQKKAVGAAMEIALSKVPPIKHDPAMVMRTLRFLLSIAICADNGICDTQILLNLFEGEIVSFLNGTCAQMKEDDIYRADSLNLANFIRRHRGIAPPYWANPSRQKQQFFCEYLRAAPSANPL